MEFGLASLADGEDCSKVIDLGCRRTLRDKCHQTMHNAGENVHEFAVPRTDSAVYMIYSEIPKRGVSLRVDGVACK